LGVPFPFPTLLDLLGLWLLLLFVSGTIRFFFRYFLLGDLLPLGDCALRSFRFSSAGTDFDGEDLEGEKVRDWLRERWRHLPLRVVEPVEGTCIGGVLPELRRRFLPLSSGTSRRCGWVGLVGDETIEAMLKCWVMAVEVVILRVFALSGGVMPRNPRYTWNC
jgi:hypothetical protein